jgi:hypothetical protein
VNAVYWLQVRDRCALYLAHLEGRAGKPDMVVPKLDVPLPNLEKALQEYLAGPMDAPFDVQSVDRSFEEPAVIMCAPRTTACLLWGLPAVFLRLLYCIICCIYYFEASANAAAEL